MIQKLSTVTLSNDAILRVNELKVKPENNNKFLRIFVDSGGCSGFQYIFKFDDSLKIDDVQLYSDENNIIAVTDEISLQFLNECVIDFIKELGASYFKVSNPNAKANCGCGSSFSV